MMETLTLLTKLVDLMPAAMHRGSALQHRSGRTGAWTPIKVRGQPFETEVQIEAAAKLRRNQIGQPAIHFLLKTEQPTLCVARGGGRSSQADACGRGQRNLLRLPAGLQRA